MFKTFLIICFFISVNSFKNKIDFKVLEEITDKIFQNYFTLDVIFYGKIDRKINSIMMNFVKALDLKFTIRTRRSLLTKVEIKVSSLIFVETLEDLSIFLEKAVFADETFDAIFILVYIRKTFKKFDEKFNKIIKPMMPDSQNGHISQFIYFIIDDGIKLELKTFEWWTQHKCNELSLVTLNIRYSNTSKWELEPLKIPEKFTNFYGCELKYSAKFFHIYTLEIMERLKVIRIASMIQQQIFKIVEQRNEKDQEFCSIFAKKGNFSFIIDKNSPQILQNPSWFSSQGCSMDFHENPIVTMFSPPDPFTDYEKMLLPFDAMTWIFLISVFISTFLASLLIKKLSKNQKKLFISKSGRRSSLNVTAIFFGDSQKRLPENNFARIILMTFILFFFIMRNAYQSKQKYYSKILFKAKF